MDVNLKYVNSSLRTPASGSPYKTLNFAAVDEQGKPLVVDGHLVRVTHRVHEDTSIPLMDQIAEIDINGAAFELDTVPATPSKFTDGGMVYHANRAGTVFMPASIARSMDKDGHAIVSTPRPDTPLISYWNLVEVTGEPRLVRNLFRIKGAQVPVAAVDTEEVA